MNHDLSIAFIGGGNMAAALIAGLADKVCPMSHIHVIDVNADIRAQWAAQGASVAEGPDARLSACTVWVLALKPQVLKPVVEGLQPFLQNSLIISVAAGIRAADLSSWLGSAQQPWPRVVRCMPNTPALIGQGASGLAALPGVNAEDRSLASAVLEAVGSVVWVEPEAELDAVTAVSGSGPAYVFLLIEAMIEGGMSLGLSAEQARALTLQTLAGATQLAAQSTEPPSVLRERVTSKGGTTFAALEVMRENGLKDTVIQAMQAAARRATEMGDAFSR